MWAMFATDMFILCLFRVSSVDQSIGPFIHKCVRFPQNMQNFHELSVSTMWMKAKANHITSTSTESQFLWRSFFFVLFALFGHDFISISGLMLYEYAERATLRHVQWQWRVIEREREMNNDRKEWQRCRSDRHKSESRK